MENKTKKIIAVNLAIALIIFCIIPVVGIYSGSFDKMLAEPKLTPSEFLSQSPYSIVNIFGKDLVFSQKGSSAWVYSLGILTMLIGFYFVAKSNKQKSRMLWGYSLFFWGLAAILAGISYQSFGYMLKASGREYVLFTSWFEIFYMLLQAYSTALMVSAVGYITLKTQKGRDNINIYSSFVLLFYFVIMLIGVAISNTFLVSYTGFILFCGYNYLVMAMLSIYHYFKNKDKLNKYMVILWISFLFVNVGYFIHLLCFDSVASWQNGGVWFTENDTLHVLLIIWMVQIFVMLKNNLKDKQING